MRCQGIIASLAVHSLLAALAVAQDMDATESAPADATPTSVPQSMRPEMLLEELAYRSLGDVPIHGYLLRHADSTSRPLIVHAHGDGYGGQYEVQWRWARSGVNVAGFDVRGLGRSSQALAKRSPWGFMLARIEAPETYSLRGAVCDYVRLVQVVREMLGAEVDRVVLHGASFAGGLALMAEAVIRAADLLVVAVPTFGWAEGRGFFVKTGSGSEINAYLQRRPESAEDVMVVLRYFDPINFADRVRCPTLFGVGLRDDVVPAPTVYAIANHTIAAHEIMEFPVSHSASPEERLWSRFEDRFLDLATHGVPSSFGTK